MGRRRKIKKRVCEKERRRKGEKRGGRRSSRLRHLHLFMPIGQSVGQQTGPTCRCAFGVRTKHTEQWQRTMPCRAHQHTQFHQLRPTPRSLLMGACALSHSQHSFSPSIGPFSAPPPPSHPSLSLSCLLSILSPSPPHTPSRVPIDQFCNRMNVVYMT